jgi:ERCC4-type nuclease
VTELLIDDRVGSRELIEHPCIKPLASLTRLHSGDVAILGNGPNGRLALGLELKSLADVLASFDTGRLQATQIEAMREDYDVQWVLIYGRWRASSDGYLLRWVDERRGLAGSGRLVAGSDRFGPGWEPVLIGRNGRRKGDDRTPNPAKYTYLAGALASVAALGFHYDHVDDMAQAAHWIASLHRWWTKPWAAHDLMRTFDNSQRIALGPFDEIDVAVRDQVKAIAEFAMKIPGVGFEKALAVAMHFGSVREMANAEVDEWAAITYKTRGETGRVVRVGRVVAEAAVRWLRREKKHEQQK